MVRLEGLKIMSDVYVAGGDTRHPLASPLYADLTGLPPILIHVGDAETLLDDSVRFTARAREAGVDVTLEVWPALIQPSRSSASRARALRQPALPIYALLGVPALHTSGDAA